MNHNCIKCGAPLVVGENTTQNNLDISQYICRSCKRERQQEQNHRIGRYRPMSKNRDCASFLGVHVAERVLAEVFENAERMPYNTPGYDFICGGGHKIDVKSACRYHRVNCADMWVFHIRKNQIAEHFLCLAFDNRDDLTPEHIWLIPSGEINNYVGVGISETTLAKWDQYKLDINKVSACCNMLRNV